LTFSETKKPAGVIRSLLMATNLRRVFTHGCRLY
jgi:hypothetical protein